MFLVKHADAGAAYREALQTAKKPRLMQLLAANRYLYERVHLDIHTDTGLDPKRQIHQQWRRFIVFLVTMGNLGKKPLPIPLHLLYGQNLHLERNEKPNQ